MIALSLDMQVSRSVEDVFAFVSDVSRLPEWAAVISSVSEPDGEAAGVGAEFDVVLSFMGRQAEGRYRVKESDHNVAFAIETLSGPVELTSSYRFQPAAEGTRLFVTSSGSASALPRFLESSVSNVIRRQFEADHRRLKELLESAAQGAG